MSYGYQYDGPPTKCHGGPRPGAVALAAGFMERFRCGTDGIYNCRPIRVHGATTLSFHADGRAWDAHAAGGLNTEIATSAVDWAPDLGIQEVISRGRRWTSQDRIWHGYHGDDPHEQHVHIALCSAAAEGLTLAAVHLVVTPVPPTTPGDTDMHLIQITDGPDNGKVFLINGDCRRYIDTGPELDQFIGLLGPVKPLGNAAWQNLVELTALDAPGLRSIPPAQYQALVADVTEKVLAGVLQDDGPLHQWIETVGNQVRHVQSEVDYIVAQSGWPPFPQ